MPPKGVSSRTLAENAGISHTLVNRKRRQGKSDEDIVAEAQVRLGRPQPPTAREALPQRDETYAEAQARKESALADLRELELAKERGELISAADVTTAWSAHISAAKGRLLSMPDELMDKLAAESNAIRCRELVLEKVRTALAELADE